MSRDPADELRMTNCIYLRISNDQLALCCWTRLHHQQSDLLFLCLEIRCFLVVQSFCLRPFRSLVGSDAAALVIHRARAQNGTSKSRSPKGSNKGVIHCFFWPGEPAKKFRIRKLTNSRARANNES